VVRASCPPPLGSGFGGPKSAPGKARDSRTERVGFGPTDADGNPAGSNTAFMIGARYDFLGGRYPFRLEPESTQDAWGGFLAPGVLLSGG